MRYADSCKSFESINGRISKSISEWQVASLVAVLLNAAASITGQNLLASYTILSSASSVLNRQPVTMSKLEFELAAAGKGKSLFVFVCSSNGYSLQSVRIATLSTCQSALHYTAAVLDFCYRSACASGKT